MTREEFSHILYERRVESGVSVQDLCFHLRSWYSKVQNIEKGRHGYNLQACLDYVAAIHATMILEDFNKNYIKITDYDSLVDNVVAIRKNTIPQVLLIKKTGCSRHAIHCFENKKTTITIDNFLKIADAVGFTIKIIPNDE